MVHIFLGTRESELRLLMGSQGMAKTRSFVPVKAES